MVTDWSRCKAEALVDTLADGLEEKNVEALGNTTQSSKGRGASRQNSRQGSGGKAADISRQNGSGEVEEVDDTVPDRQAEVKSKQRFGGVRQHFPNWPCFGL